MRNICQDKLDTAVGVLNKNDPPCMVKLVIEAMGNNEPNQESFSLLCRLVMINKYTWDTNDSTITTLLCILGEKEVCHYIYFTGPYDQRIRQVNIYKHMQKQKKGNKRWQLGKIGNTERGEISNRLHDIFCSSLVKGRGSVPYLPTKKNEFPLKQQKSLISDMPRKWKKTARMLHEK